jgi:hypothetical protein
MPASLLLQDDAAAASWYPVNSLPSLAFDHNQIIREAFQKLLERPEVKQAGVLALFLCGQIRIWIISSAASIGDSVSYCY